MWTSGGLNQQLTASGHICRSCSASNSPTGPRMLVWMIKITIIINTLRRCPEPWRGKPPTHQNPQPPPTHPPDLRQETTILVNNQFGSWRFSLINVMFLDKQKKKNSRFVVGGFHRQKAAANLSSVFNYFGNNPF